MYNYQSKAEYENSFLSLKLLKRVSKRTWVVIFFFFKYLTFHYLYLIIQLFLFAFPASMSMFGQIQATIAVWAGLIKDFGQG